jgi:hypothetical protein
MSKPTTPKTGREWGEEWDEIVKSYIEFDITHESVENMTDRLKELVSSSLSQERQRIREGVEGMKLPANTRHYITKAEPINKKLQDVLKLLGE